MKRIRPADLLNLVPAALALLMLILMVPSGEAVTAARNAYYMNETPDTPVIALRMYGLAAALGALCAMLLVGLAVRGETALRFIGAGAIAALIGARFLFCLVNLNIYMPEMGGSLSVLRLWDGGLSFYGALWALLLVAWGFRRQAGFDRLCGTLALAVPLLLFAFRLAEEWSGAGYGMSVDWEGIFSIPGRFGGKLSVRRIEMPCALLAGALAALEGRKRGRTGAERLAVSCFLIGAMQILLESLRYDRHMIWGFVKAEQIAGLLTAVGAMLYLLRGQPKRQLWAVLAGVLVALGVFGLEKALDRLSVSSWLLYGVFVLLIVGYAWVSERMTRGINSHA